MDTVPSRFRGVTLTTEEVLQTALLARLYLEEQEVEPMCRELSAILGYVEALAGLDVSGVEPMTHAVAQAGPLRDDVLGEMLDAETALAGAPRRDGALFVVPKVVE